MLVFWKGEKEMSQKKEIYLAGGCFWGTEKFFKNLPGVVFTETGYANGKTENPSYEEVCYTGTDHAETVHIIFEENQLSLESLLEAFYCVIDPIAIDRQGADVGRQYRTGIYYTEKKDEIVIRKSIENLQKEYKEPIAIEVQPLFQFYRAEEFHQDYLEKNPGGYCHISLPLALKKWEKKRQACVKKEQYHKKSLEELKKELTPIQFSVTQRNETEPPFQNEYWNQFEKGIYVDITTGEPLFLSNDKFESECGWPSFSKPIDPNVIEEFADFSFGMERTEVRSRVGNVHLGHVFEDAPKELGGMRYCINSAALRFIPIEKMKEEGYEAFLSLFS